MVCLFGGNNSRTCFSGNSLFVFLSTNLKSFVVTYSNELEVFSRSKTNCKSLTLSFKSFINTGIHPNRCFNISLLNIVVLCSISIDSSLVSKTATSISAIIVLRNPLTILTFVLLILNVNISCSSKIESILGRGIELKYSSDSFFSVSVLID